LADYFSLVVGAAHFYFMAAFYFSLFLVAERKI
jgi:hypothetical protein